MAKKITISEDRLKELLKEEREREDNLKKAQEDVDNWKYRKAGSIAATGIGTGIYALGKHGERLSKGGPMGHLMFDKSSINAAKKTGIGVAIAGLGSYGISRYMHNKTKKKLKQLENDNSKN